MLTEKSLLLLLLHLVVEQQNLNSTECTFFCSFRYGHAAKRHSHCNLHSCSSQREHALWLLDQMIILTFYPNAIPYWIRLCHSMCHSQPVVGSWPQSHKYCWNMHLIVQAQQKKKEKRWLHNIVEICAFIRWLIKIVVLLGWSVTITSPWTFSPLNFYIFCYSFVLVR